MAETNKTEKATPKKRRDERKKGNAFQSREVISVAVLIVGFVLISRLGSFIMLQIKGLFISCLDLMGGLHTLTAASCLLIMKEAMAAFFISTVPILAALALTGIVMTGAQTDSWFRESFCGSNSAGSASSKDSRGCFPSGLWFSW